MTKANLQTALSSAQNSQTKARENKSNIDAKVSALQAQAQVDEQKISTDAQRQFSVIQSNLAQAGIDMSGQSNPFGTYSSSAIFTALAAQNSVAKPGQKLTLAQAQKQALAVNTDASATSLLDGSINLLA